MTAVHIQQERCLPEHRVVRNGDRNLYLATRGPLIFGTSYVEGQEARYTISLWRDVVTKLNPGADIMIIDSASPDLPDMGGVEVLQLGDNIGHLGKTGRDGWGRAFCAGLRYAVKRGYSAVAHIETDLLFAHPVADVFAKMHQSRVKVAAPMAYPHQFIETALMFMDVGFVAEMDLPGLYHWEASTAATYPEVRLEGAIGSALFALPLRGLRNDLRQVNANNMARSFPNGIDWITHADPATLRAFLELNGL